MAAVDDISMFAGGLRPPPTIQDYIQANLANQQNALKVQSDQQSLTDQNALRQATMQLGNDPNQNLQTLRQAGLFAPSQAYQASLYNNQKTQSETGRNISEIPANAARAQEQTALAGQHTQDTEIAAHNFALQQLGGINDPSQVPAWIHDNTGPGKAFSYDQGMQGYQLFQKAMNGPDGFAGWKASAMQGGQSITDQLKQQQAAQLAAQAQAGENSRNAATIAASRANNQANIAKDYKVNFLDSQGNFAGMGGATAPATPGLSQQGAPPTAQPTPGQSGGAPAASPIQGMVDSIGKYVAPESVVLQRVPPAMKSMVLSAVQNNYPDYSPANYAGVQKTIGSMAAGPLGAATRANNVSLTHLDTLSSLVDAMGNGDLPLVNKLKNAWQTQTGQAAPTNMAAARQLVMGEVANVVAGGGATLGDRQTAEAAIGANGSPAQLSGAINTVIKPLMAGKLQGLEQQYKAGSLRDDFRAKYLSPAARASLETISPSGTPSSAAANPNSVATPDGRVHTFPNAAAAAAFKKDAGL